jgi:hypothetical protein
MPDRPSNLARAPRAALSAALLSLLAGCGPPLNQFAPPCPGQAILGDAADFDIHRSGAGDLTDLVLHGRIIGIQGSCKAGSKKDQLAVTVQLGVEVTRGPAMTGREADVPVFIAVADGTTIIDKRAVTMRVVFPSNVDRVALSPGEMTLVLPVSPQKSGVAYTILGGFQLAPDQMGRYRPSHLP